MNEMPSRERQALEIAYRELLQISRIGGFKKSTEKVLAAILALVPDLIPSHGIPPRRT
jgi:hypothetical protein